MHKNKFTHKNKNRIFKICKIAKIKKIKNEKIVKYKDNRR
jgi:hypothetical protein